jgi:hypothetical protein
MGTPRSFLPAFGAALISLVISFSPVGATVERLKQSDFDDIK